MFDPINMDFQEDIILNLDEIEWENSPLPGVERKKLERENQETGRTTSLVRYLKNSYFDEHIHHGGEEIFVIEGTFSDETGDYPKGTYLRNPISSSHRPFSKQGCLLFVKLCQFLKNDTATSAINTFESKWHKQDSIKKICLHKFHDEEVYLVKIASGASKKFSHRNGIELMIIDGEIECMDQNMKSLSWVRSLRRKDLVLTAKKNSLIYLKLNHLTN